MGADVQYIVIFAINREKYHGEQPLAPIVVLQR